MKRLTLQRRMQQNLSRRRLNYIFMTILEDIYETDLKN